MSDVSQKANLQLYRQRLLDLGLFSGNPNQEIAIEHIEMVSKEVSWEELNERLIDVETDIQMAKRNGQNTLVHLNYSGNALIEREARLKDRYNSLLVPCRDANYALEAKIRNLNSGLNVFTWATF